MVVRPPLLTSVARRRRRSGVGTTKVARAGCLRGGHFLNGYDGRRLDGYDGRRLDGLWHEDPQERVDEKLAPGDQHESDYE
jgi:hypothetical protein